MTWPAFSSLGAAWLLLLFVPLVLFYFLKLKRPRVEIPSLVLWRQVMNDQRVNAPFQRFKRSLLLLLQLLMLACLILAAMQPYLPSGAERARYVPVLIDCSASMAAVDRPGGTARLELARQRVRELIDNLLPDQRLSLIAFDSTARRLTDFTDNKRLLHDALDELEDVQVSSNVEDALRMTQALSRTVPIPSVLMFTDGNLPEQVDFELPFELNYQRLPGGGANMGITALNARRSRGAAWDVFVRVDGSRHGTTEAAIELLQDGTRVAEDEVILDPGQSQRLVFSIDAEQAADVEVRLKPSGFDSLDSDNVAYLDLPVLRRLAVYCPEELTTYRHALRTDTTLAVFPAADGSAGPGAYDLLITDQPATEVEAAVALYVGVVPDDLKDRVAIDTGLAEIVDWQRTEPLLQHTQLADVQIADVPRSGEDVGPAEFEELGYRILVHGGSGPLLLERRNATGLAYYLLFHTDRSTLPYRVSFPILVANLVQIALQHAALSEVRAHATGLLPPVRLQPDEAYRVVGPGGTERRVESTQAGVVAGVPAPHVGRYEVRSSSQPPARLAVSLLGPGETSLGGVERIQFKEIGVSAAAERVETDRPLWPLFALAGFVLLLVEWWYYQRRPGGVPA